MDGHSPHAHSLLGLRCSCFALLLVAITQASTQENATDSPHKVAYWDAVYSESVRAGVKNFARAWQGLDLDTLRGVLKLELRPHDRFIVLGAGDSGLSEELFDAGCRNVTAVDFSPQLVRAMAERSHGVLWRLEDARKLSFAEGSFDMAIDAGLLDAVAAGGGEPVGEVLAEVHRVLASGGVYASVSTEPPLYRLPFFEPQSAGKDGWQTEVLFTPRNRSLDPRVRRIDVALDMDKLSVYVSSKPAEVAAVNGTEEVIAVETEVGVNGTEVLSVEADGTVVRVANDSASATHETTPTEPVEAVLGKSEESQPSEAQVAASIDETGPVEYVQWSAFEIAGGKPAEASAELNPAQPGKTAQSVSVARENFNPAEPVEIVQSASVAEEKSEPADPAGVARSTSVAEPDAQVSELSHESKPVDPVEVAGESKSVDLVELAHSTSMAGEDPPVSE